MQRLDTMTLKGDLDLEFTDVRTGKVQVYHYNNLVVTTGKNAIADALRGNTANNRGIITYAALGTGTNSPALADTTLQTEIFRKQISVSSVIGTGNTAEFKTFFNTGEANGALKEAGLFGDNADSSPNSGTLFCRTSINRTKTINDTLTLTWRVTVS